MKRRYGVGKAHEPVRQRRVLGAGYSGEDWETAAGENAAENETTMEETEEADEDEDLIEGIPEAPADATIEELEEVEEKIGAGLAQEATVALRQRKPWKSQWKGKPGARTVRRRKKIGGELIEKGIQEQKARIKAQINELPKERRRAFLEELLERM